MASHQSSLGTGPVLEQTGWLFRHPKSRLLNLLVREHQGCRRNNPAVCHPSSTSGWCCWVPLSVCLFALIRGCVSHYISFFSFSFSSCLVSRLLCFYNFPVVALYTHKCFSAPVLVFFTQSLLISKIPATPLSHPASPLHPSARPRWIERSLPCCRDPGTSWSYTELCRSLSLLKWQPSVPHPGGGGVYTALALAPMDNTL